MYRRIVPLLFLVLTAFTMTSCFDSGAYSTPELYAFEKMYRISAEGVRDTIAFGDTIHVGDTVRGPLVVSGGYNSLTFFEVKVDKSVFDCHLEYDTAYSRLLAETSRPEEGYLSFLPGTSVFPVVMYLVPKLTGDYVISFTVANDAGEAYSPRAFTYTQSIR